MLYAILRVIRQLCVSLWLGGTFALLLFVTRLFGASHEIGMSAAPILFRTFALWQLIVGAIAMISACEIFLLNRRKIELAIALLLAAALFTAMPIRAWTYEIDTLRISNQTQSPRFKELHRNSGIAYSFSAICLTASAVALAFSDPARGGRPAEIT